MSSLSDIFTTAKNISVAINNAAQVYLKVQGAQRSATLTTTSLVSSQQGRLASISVIVAGSTAGIIYDSSVTGSLINALAVIANTVGVTVVNLPYNTGLVVVPGTGMTVVVSYSEG
jgi:energy-converting hydrogenase Eha subunit E